MRTGTVLMYNCSAPGFSKLRQIFAMLKLRMRVVNPNQYDIPLIELAQGKGEPNEALTEAIPESMLVFCGVNGALCAQVLEVIRLTKLPPIPLKAILTEDNKDWNTIQLHEELLKEKAALEEQ